MEAARAHPQEDVAKTPVLIRIKDFGNGEEHEVTAFIEKPADVGAELRGLERAVEALEPGARTRSFADAAATFRIRRLFIVAYYLERPNHLAPRAPRVAPDDTLEQNPLFD